MSRGIAEPNSHLADARWPHGADGGALEPEQLLVRALAVRHVVSVMSSVKSSQHQMSAFSKNTSLVTQMQIVPYQLGHITPAHRFPFEQRR